LVQDLKYYETHSYSQTISIPKATLPLTFTLFTPESVYIPWLYFNLQVKRRLIPFGISSSSAIIFHINQHSFHQPDKLLVSLFLVQYYPLHQSQIKERIYRPLRCSMTDFKMQVRAMRTSRITRKRNCIAFFKKYESFFYHKVN
jgi:hypothetical protein